MDVCQDPNEMDDRVGNSRRCVGVCVCGMRASDSSNDVYESVSVCLSVCLCACVCVCLYLRLRVHVWIFVKYNSVTYAGLFI